MILPPGCAVLLQLQRIRFRAVEFWWKRSWTTAVSTLAHYLSIPPDRTHPEALKRNHQYAGQSIKQSLDWQVLDSGFAEQAVRTLLAAGLCWLQQLHCWRPSPVPMPNICPHAVPLQQRLCQQACDWGRCSSSHPACGRCPLVMKSQRAGCTSSTWTAVPILWRDRKIGPWPTSHGNWPLSKMNTICS